MSNAAQIELGSVVSLWRYPVKPRGTRRSWNSSIDVEELLKLLQHFF